MKWFKPKQQTESRLFFTTDIHGSERCFRKFLNAARVYEAQTILIGGDITGKRICPVIERRGGTWDARWAGQQVTLASRAEVEQLQTDAANAGMYAFTCGEDEARAMDADATLVEQRFLELAMRRLEGWMALAEERLAGSGVNMIVNCGNDDPFELDAIIEGSDAVRFAEGRLVPIDERRTLASVGYANRTPWDCVRDVEDDEVGRRIEQAIAGWQDGAEQLVLNLHCPPHDTALDQAPMLDEQLRPVTEGGQIVIGPVGSRAVREAIARHQPILALHGHVHESRGVERIGETVCVNPGSEYPDGVLRGVVVDFDREGVKGYVLTSS